MDTVPSLLPSLPIGCITGHNDRQDNQRKLNRRKVIYDYVTNTYNKEQEFRITNGEETLGYSTKPCRATRCATCPYILDRQFLESTTTRKKFACQVANANCKTVGVVYLLSTSTARQSTALCSYDFSTLFTSLPHELVQREIFALIDRLVKQSTVVITKHRAFLK